MQQPTINNILLRTLGAFMAFILLALGAYLQVPVIESLTHDSHHNQKEIYAFAAEVEECVEEDRSDFHTTVQLFNSALVAVAQKYCLDGLCFWQTSLSRLEKNNRTFLSPINRKIYLLCGRLSSQLPQ